MSLIKYCKDICDANLRVDTHQLLSGSKWYIWTDIFEGKNVGNFPELSVVENAVNEYYVNSVVKHISDMPKDIKSSHEDVGIKPRSLNQRYISNLLERLNYLQKLAGKFKVGGLFNAAIAGLWGRILCNSQNISKENMEDGESITTCGNLLIDLETAIVASSDDDSNLISFNLILFVLNEQHVIINHFEVAEALQVFVAGQECMKILLQCTLMTNIKHITIRNLQPLFSQVWGVYGDYPAAIVERTLKAIGDVIEISSQCDAYEANFVFNVIKIIMG